MSLARSLPLILALWCLLCPHSAGAAPAHSLDRELEYRVKAAYIFNFAKFVTWPEKTFATPSSPITLCVLGDSSVFKYFESVNGKMLKGRSFRVKTCSSWKNLLSRPCNILYVMDDFPCSEKIPPSLSSQPPILTIGQSSSFLDHGGMVRFFIEDEKIRFQINQEPALHAGIKISSRLLKLSKKPTDRKDEP